MEDNLKKKKDRQKVFRTRIGLKTAIYFKSFLDIFFKSFLDIFKRVFNFIKSKKWLFLLLILFFVFLLLVFNEKLLLNLLLLIFNLMSFIIPFTLAEFTLSKTKTDNANSLVNTFLIEKHKLYIYFVAFFISSFGILDHSLYRELDFENIVPYMFNHVPEFIALNFVSSFFLFSYQFFFSTSKYKISSEELLSHDPSQFFKSAVFQKDEYNKINIIPWALLVAYFFFSSQPINPIILFFALLYLIWCIRPLFPNEKAIPKRLESLNLTNINIHEEDFFKLPIYFFDNKDKKSSLESQEKKSNYVSFKLDIDNLFPENSKEEGRELYFESANQPILDSSDRVENLKESKKSVILLFNFDFEKKINLLELKTYISYSEGDEERVEFFHLLVCFETIHGIIVPMQKYLYDHKKYPAFKSQKNLNVFSSGETHLDNDEIKKKLSLACHNLYCYTEEKENEELKKVVLDNRKVLAHEKEFGVGKTTYDILSVSKQNFIPITISAWEANYDHDVLYLIFDTIKKATGTKSFKNPPRILWGVFLLAFLPLVSLIKGFFDSPIIVAPAKSYEYLIEYRNKFLLEYTDGSLFKHTNGLFEDNYKLLVFIFIVVIFSLWICFRHTPDFLIFKKDNTQVYKDFYVDNIINMLRNNPNHIFLIEDIDRLEPRVINEVFRILSSINSRLPKSFRRFAIVSYSRKIVTEKLDKIGITYNEVTNKVIASSDWGKNYNAKESMKIYNELNFNMLKNALKDGEQHSEIEKVNEIYEIVKELIEKDNFNFRNLYSVWEELYDTLANSAVGSLDDLLEKLKEILKDENEEC